MANPPKPGVVRCLGPGCNKTFRSRDRATNRICPSCSRKISRDTEPRVSVSYPYGKRTDHLQDY